MEQQQAGDQQHQSFKLTPPNKQKGSSRGTKIVIGIIVILILFIIGSMINKSTPSASKPAAPDNTNSSSNSSSQQSQPTQASATPAKQPQVLLDISGNGTKSTQKFTAASDWDLEWSYDCTSTGSQGNFQVYIYNSDGSISTDNNLVNQLGTKDSSVEHYHTGGTFYLEINSECSWHVTAKG